MFFPNLFYYKFITRKLSLILCISLLLMANRHGRHYCCTQALDQTSHTVQRGSERDTDRRRATDLDHRCHPHSQASGASKNRPPREGEAGADAATGTHGCPSSPQMYRREPPRCNASGGLHKTFPGRAPLPVTSGTAVRPLVKSGTAAA